jgi:hypothetical protein
MTEIEGEQKVKSVVVMEPREDLFQKQIQRH